jgi:hypothetical protein
MCKNKVVSYFKLLAQRMPTPLPGRSKPWVFSRSLLGVAGSNPAGDMDVCLSVVRVMCCQVEVSESG